MGVCDKILQFNQTDNCFKNDDISDLVLRDFMDNVNDVFNFEAHDCSTSKLITLKEDYIYKSDCVKLFFDILKKYNYNMKQEIKDAIFKLGRLDDPNKNSELIKEILCSPIIQDISYNGKNEFIITSEEYGKFSFELASHYFRKNEKMNNYIKNNQLARGCHNHAYFMSTVFPDYYAITALCKYYFEGSYYHSYTYDKDSSLIIDLCYNAIISMNSYYELFEPKDISVILNCDVEKELALTNLKTDQYRDRCHLLKIALYKQYLDSINYHDDLEKAPSIKK